MNKIQIFNMLRTTYLFGIVIAAILFHLSSCLDSNTKDEISLEELTMKEGILNNLESLDSYLKEIMIKLKDSFVNHDINADSKSEEVSNEEKEINNEVGSVAQTDLISKTTISSNTFVDLNDKSELNLKENENINQDAVNNLSNEDSKFGNTFQDLQTTESQLEFNSQKIAKFPPNFSSQVDFDEKRVFTWDFYMDSDLKMYRIDSFGVPATEEQLKEDNPLFIFIYSFNDNLLYSFFSNPHGDAYTCRISKTLPLKEFPSLQNSGFLSKMNYIGEIEQKNVVLIKRREHQNNPIDIESPIKVDYFSIDAGGLFTIDLMIRQDNGLPVKMGVSTDNIYFSNFKDEKPNPKIWEFPTHERCDSSSLKEEELKLLPDFIRKRLFHI